MADAAWMKRLALSLVDDDAATEDIVQETWLKALERPPTASPTPGWIRAVIRNLAYRRRRADGRRRARERAAARPEILRQAPDQVLERVELQQRLIELVLRLKEPYRSSILFRFFEELTPKEIARRERVPESTVRSRLARALDQLRTRLDRDHGSRAAWLALIPLSTLGREQLCAALADASALSAPAIPSFPLHFFLGGLLMTKKTIAIAISTFVLGGLLVRLGADRAQVADPGAARLAEELAAKQIEIEALSAEVKSLSSKLDREQRAAEALRLAASTPAPVDAPDLSDALAWLRRHAPRIYEDVTVGELASMRRIDLSGTALTAADLETLRPYLAIAKEIDLSRAKLSPEVLSELAGLDGLRKLVLDGTGLGDEDLGLLRGMSGLQSLSLTGTSVTDVGLGELGEMVSLESLDLSRLAVTDDGLAALRALTSLKSITLNGTPVRGEGLAHLPLLRELCMLGPEVNRAGFQAIASMHGLETLSLSKTEVPDEALLHISRLPSLRNLLIGDKGLTDTALEHIGRMTALEFLDVRHAQFTDAGMAHFQHLRSLKRLRLMVSDISDAGIAQLSSLPDLQELSLIGTTLSDAGATELQRLPLITLDLRQTKVTPEWVAAYKASHPQCDVLR